MITQLYTFSPGAFVVADEWNANFRSLYQVSLEHTEAIQDANNNIAFPDSDLSAVFARINAEPNSFVLYGTSDVILPDCEYYKTTPLPSSEQIVVTVRKGMNGQARIVFNVGELRDFTPIIFNYGDNPSDVIWTDSPDNRKKPGMKFVFLCERGGKLFVKMITTE